MIHLTWFLFSVNKDKDTQEEQSMFHSSLANDTNKNHVFRIFFSFLEALEYDFIAFLCELFEKEPSDFCNNTYSNW